MEQIFNILIVAGTLGLLLVVAADWWSRSE